MGDMEQKIKVKNYRDQNGILGFWEDRFTCLCIHKNTETPTFIAFYASQKTGINKCYVNRFTSLCKNLFNFLEFLADAFRWMTCASFSLLNGSGVTGCDVPVHGCWNSRDVIMAGVFVSKSVWDL